MASVSQALEETKPEKDGCVGAFASVSQGSASLTIRVWLGDCGSQGTVGIRQVTKIFSLEDPASLIFFPIFPFAFPHWAENNNEWY